jgi:hypothetical protein
MLQFEYLCGWNSTISNHKLGCALSPKSFTHGAWPEIARWSFPVVYMHNDLLSTGFRAKLRVSIILS